MSKRILGLDLGTNSIGWAVVDDLGNGQFERIKEGVHIFQEGVKIEKGNESSKASERTGYRSARRIKFRRKLRKIETLKALSVAGFCPALSTQELKDWQSKKIYPENQEFRDWCKTSEEDSKNPYYYRWQAVTITLNLDDEADRFKLGRAFFHMAQRRGFKSNRLDAGSDDAIGALRDRALAVLAGGYREKEELHDAVSALFSDDEQDAKVRRFQRAVLKGISAADSLDSAMVFLTGFLNKRENLGKVKGEIVDLSSKMDGRTLGQYFWEECYQQGKRIRNVHTARDEHYLAEFNLICEKQELPETLREELRDAIFYQRPLRSQKGLVANCPFEPKKKRCPISHPLFEEFRMWQTLNNVKIKTLDDEDLRPLSEDEKKRIIPLFFRVSKAHFDFRDIAKKLTPRGQEFGYAKGRDTQAHVLFNYRANESLSGCPFTAKLRNLFGEDLLQGVLKAYKGKRLSKDGIARTGGDLLNEVWHVLFSFDDEAKVKAYAVNKLGLDDTAAERFAKINAGQGYGALSLKAIRKILPFMKQGFLYSHAVFFANLDGVLGEGAEKDVALRDDVSRLIDEHNQYVAEVRCVNEFVRQHKDNPKEFGEQYDLRNVQAFAEKLPSSLQDRADSICREVRVQIAVNNGNGEYLVAKRLHDRIGDYLVDRHGADDEAVKMLYHPSAIETYKPAEKHSDGKYYLGDPRISSIRNPVFMRAMHRVKAVVNELLKRGIVTDQTAIHLEMARELNDANKRVAVKIWQRKNEQKRTEYADIIEKRLGRNAGDDEILKYQLWTEQSEFCPYCNEKINVSTLLSEQSEIEHTIPRSLCCDNSQENKTVAHKQCNREKNNRIPFECSNYDQILLRVDHWRQAVEDLNGQIEKKKIASQRATTKELKDRAIQARLVLQFERDYLRNKYRRFTMEEVPEGFKNSQLVDTRIITKYARMYLKTVFTKVHTVNGKTTDDFRRCWGIEKSRDNHVHHTIDAIVVACVTRERYDNLAQFYHQYESYESNDPTVPEKPHFSKPWKSFTKDMKELRNEILVSHYAPNHLLKQTKKRAKVRGKIVVQQGQTARGSLHKDTFYGAIKRLEENKKGEIKEVVKYVARKKLTDLKDSDVKNIVDDRVREIVTHGRAEEARLKKEIDTLKKKRATTDEVGESAIRQQVAELERKMGGLYVLPNKNGDPIPIRKVRLYSPVANPISLKFHRDRAVNSPHKHHLFVKPDDSYAFVIWEGETGKGRVRRVANVYNTYEATQGLVSLPRYGDSKEIGSGLLHFKQSYLVGDMVLLREGLERDDGLLNRRLYIVFGIESDGRIKLRYHAEGRKDEEQGREVSVFDPVNPPPKLRISASKFDVLKDGVDFRLGVLGDVEFIEG
ncbi:type II CRISPR RNA-guided endonuclease Cas9 [Pontiellaceae bacterium B1224]|nr:type II CRISPR RNA-guided endonuclease Cas9 [Pontiellaceae bacterium B1224]